MFDGVGWAAGEIVVFMLIATLIGFAIAWIFGRWLQRGTIGDEYESELTVQRERSKHAEERLSASNADLDKALLEVKAERGKLEAETAAKAELEGRLAVVADKDAEIARLMADLEACGADRERLAGEIAQSSDQIASSKERVAALEAEFATAASVAAALPDASETEPEVMGLAQEPESVVVKQADPSKEEGLARLAEIAARTAGDGPVADDDLKKVHGVGPKLEGTLKGLGITSFRQIANFQKDDIAYVTAALGAFKGRIERDDWMSSAAEEHANKYNEPA
jgi:predicted flap endonuclease-1-like 5' DNA nuclease